MASDPNKRAIRSTGYYNAILAEDEVALRAQTLRMRSDEGADYDIEVRIRRRRAIRFLVA